MTVGPLTAIRHAFAHYADFRRRSSRAEYWWFLLFYLVLGVVGTILDLTLGRHEVTAPWHCPNNPLAGICAPPVTFMQSGYIFDLILSVPLLLPLLAVSMRRLRDAGLPRGLALIGFVPMVARDVVGYLYLATNELGYGPVFVGLEIVALVTGLVMIFLYIRPSEPRYATVPATYTHTTPN